jgi:hypothetical protein
MNRTITREQRRQLERDNEKQPILLTTVSRALWPQCNPMPTDVLRNKWYLVKIFAEPNGVIRVTVNRTTVTPDGEWLDGITWDDLMEIKRHIGMKDMYAIEILPREKDVVNVGNLRHFWVLPQPLDIGWFN